MRVPDRLLDVAERLQGVAIDCIDWREAIDRYDASGTLFYVDPPYLLETRGAKYEYRHEMSSDDHIELLSRLRELDGMAVISGYPSALYDDLLRGWRRVETSARRLTSATATECLWLSPSADDNNHQLTLAL